MDDDRPDTFVERNAHILLAFVAYGVGAVIVVGTALVALAILLAHLLGD